MSTKSQIPINQSDVWSWSEVLGDRLWITISPFEDFYRMTLPVTLVVVNKAEYSYSYADRCSPVISLDSCCSTTIHRFYCTDFMSGEKGRTFAFPYCRSRRSQSKPSCFFELHQQSSGCRYITVMHSLADKAIMEIFWKCEHLLASGHVLRSCDQCNNTTQSNYLKSKYQKRSLDKLRGMICVLYAGLFIRQAPGSTSCFINANSLTIHQKSWKVQILKEKKYTHHGIEYFIYTILC